MLLVALREEAPRLNGAAVLQDNLWRVGIEAAGRITTQSFVGLDTRDPLLRQRARNEIPSLSEVADSLTKRASVLR